MNDLKRKLKELLIERLKFEDMTPDDIKDDDLLFAGGLGLDSIDALEIVVMLESEFGIKVKNESAARGCATMGWSVGKEPREGVATRGCERRCRVHSNTSRQPWGSLSGHGFRKVLPAA